MNLTIVTVRKLLAKQCPISIVTSVQNKDYQYRDVKIQAFINYQKDPTIKMN